MKRIFYTLFFFLLFTCTYSQAPDWAWAKSAGGTHDDIAQSVTTDASGNVYVCGGFASTSITFGVTTLINSGGFDIFLAKYDSSGNAVWAKSAGGFVWDYAYSVTTDAFGNVFIAGSFSSSSITFGSTTLTNMDSTTEDIFLAKYDASGNVLWAKSAGGTGSDGAHSVTTDASGNVYVAGDFGSSSISFGTTTLTNTGISNNDIFLTKYDSSGNVLWAKSAGGTGWDYAYSLTCDVSGNVYVAGAFGSSSITFSPTTLTNAGTSTNDIFLVKYDSVGTVLWAKSAGGIGADYAYSATTDTSGDVFVAGSFSSFSITFGLTTLTNTDSSADDIFLVKYDASGNVLWAKSAGGTYSDEAYSAKTDASSNVYITGYFYSSSISFSSTTLTNVGSADIFVANYDGAGNLLWAKSDGGNSGDYAESVATDASGNVYVTGHFISSVIPFGSTTLTNFASGDDIFLAKLSNVATGISEIDNPQSEMLIFPNPAPNSFTLQTELKNAEVTVTDVQGRIVFQSSMSNNQLSISSSAWSKGLYFVTVKNNEQEQRGKVVVE